METFQSLLAPFRSRPLHPAYRRVAEAHAEQIRRQGSIRRPAYETACPYCGTDSGVLIGIVQVGGKGRVPDVLLTRSGYSVEGIGNQTVALQLITCPACGARMPEMPYISPAAFFQDMTRETLLECEHDQRSSPYEVFLNSFPLNLRGNAMIATEPQRSLATDEEIRRLPADAMSVTGQLIRRDRIVPDPDQPRTDADDHLRESIRRQGIIKMLLVRRHPDPEQAQAGFYMLVDGERRWRGAEGVLEYLPCKVRTDQDNEVERLITQLDANLGVPLTAIEEARAFLRLLSLTGMTQSELAHFVGRPKSTVNDRLRLLELGLWIPLLESGVLGVGPALEFLVPVRNVPTAYHEEAIAAIVRSPRWTTTGGSLSSAEFGELVEEVYGKLMYPLSRARAVGAKQPEFDTADHARCCGCGGIRWRDGSDEKRLWCGNPDYWRPRQLMAQSQKASSRRVGAGKAPPAGGLQLAVPEGTPTVTAATARDQGVIQLTDGAGRWQLDAPPESGISSSDPFDPDDLSLASESIVVIERLHAWDTLDRVGTRDAGAVRSAQEKWRQRWDERKRDLERRTRELLKERSEASCIVGSGTVQVGLLRLAFAGCGERVWEIARAAGIQVPHPASTPGRAEDPSRAGAGTGSLEVLLGCLSEAEQSRLLTALGHFVAEGLRTPQEVTDQEQGQAVAEIRHRRIPWLSAEEPELALACV